MKAVSSTSLNSCAGEERVCQLLIACSIGCTKVSASGRHAIKSLQVCAVFSTHLPSPWRPSLPTYPVLQEPVTVMIVFIEWVAADGKSHNGQQYNHTTHGERPVFGSLFAAHVRKESRLSLQHFTKLSAQSLESAHAIPLTGAHSTSMHAKTYRMTKQK